MTSRNDKWELARRTFRRDTAKQAWWAILGVLFFTVIVGATSDAGALRVSQFGPVVATMLVAPVSIVLGYLGVSAWEARPDRLLRTATPRYEYEDVRGYGPPTTAYDTEEPDGAK